MLVYLILSALYESFLIPLAVVLSLPFGLFGSFLFAQLMGLENNIYMQTGIIMLIGLLAKTAILITEYAVKRREAGMSLIQAAVGGRESASAPDSDDRPDDDFRSAAADGIDGRRRNGNPHARFGSRRRYARRNAGPAVHRAVLFVAFQWLQEKIRPMQFERAGEWSIRAEMEDLQNRKEEK